MELLENQAKQYNWEQDQIAHMKNYIARFGHGSAKLARQAQSKEKTLAKMVAQGLTEKVVNDKVLNFYFPSCGTIPPPVIMVQNVSFRYNEDAPWIYKNLEFGIDLDTRIALVGPNEAGKNTLLKLLYGDLVPISRMICKNSHLRVGDITTLARVAGFRYIASRLHYEGFPRGERARRNEEDHWPLWSEWASTGCSIRQLSDSQRCRVVFTWLTWQVPYVYCE